jgi:N-acetylmuramoyl-L-alanine amidase
MRLSKQRLRSKTMVLLDPGHGNNTFGKRSPLWSDGTQLFEWEFNRNIVKRINNELLRLDIKSIIIVPEAIDISLTVRCQRANKLAQKYPGSFLVSVHGNAGENPNEGTGWEIWTSPGETESDKIATILFESAKVNLAGWKMRSDMTDGDPDKESKFAMLTKTICPAVLTENLFYDNEDDCRFMLSEEGRGLIAKLHVDGIKKYLKS